MMEWFVSCGDLRLRIPGQWFSGPRKSPHSGASGMERKIRVLVTDDHVLMREGLTHILSQEPDLEVVAEARDGVEAVELATVFQPDVILMDISMPNMNGIEATRIIHRSSPEIKIIGLSMFAADECANDMRSAGAVDYISKSDSRNLLLKAIRDSMPHNP